MSSAKLKELLLCSKKAGKDDSRHAYGTVSPRGKGCSAERVYDPHNSVTVAPSRMCNTTPKTDRSRNLYPVAGTMKQGDGQFKASVQTLRKKLQYDIEEDGGYEC